MLRVVPHMTKANEQNNEDQGFVDPPPLARPEFSCSFKIFFNVACRCSQQQKKQTVMDLEQFHLIWGDDSSPCPLSSQLRPSLAGGPDWSPRHPVNRPPSVRLGSGDVARVCLVFFPGEHFASVSNL